MNRFLVAPFLLAAALASAEGDLQPTGRTKLQDMPLLGAGSGPPPRMEGGVEVHEKRFWRNSELQRRAADLDVRIGRIWTQNDETHATVTVRNSSPFELGEIDLRCSAVMQDGREIPVAERTFRESRDGSIRPGDEKRVDLTLGGSGAKVGSISCSARGY